MATSHCCPTISSLVLWPWIYILWLLRANFLEVVISLVSTAKSMDQTECYYWCNLIFQQLFMDTVASLVAMAAGQGRHSGDGLVARVKLFFWCHTGSAFPQRVQTKAPDQPMRFCFLCLCWCLLSTYTWKNGGIYSKESRYFWSREAMCVSEYCHFVMLSENCLDFFFGRIIITSLWFNVPFKEYL